MQHDKFILGKECKTCQGKRENHILIYKGIKYILKREEQYINKWLEVQFTYMTMNPLLVNIELEKIYEAGKGAWIKI